MLFAQQMTHGSFIHLGSIKHLFCLISNEAPSQRTWFSFADVTVKAACPILLCSPEF